MNYLSLDAVDELLQDPQAPEWLLKRIETLRALIVLDLTEWVITRHEKRMEVLRGD